MNETDVVILLNGRRYAPYNDGERVCAKVKDDGTAVFQVANTFGGLTISLKLMEN